MSLGLPKVNVVKVLDPRLDLNDERTYAVLKGSLITTWTPYTATNYNNGSIQITCNPPNRNTVISRLIFKRQKWTIVVSGTNTSGGPLLNPGYFAPRCYPLVAITGAESISINNATLTQAPAYQWWLAFLWYHGNSNSRYGLDTLTPSMQDQYQTYAEGAGAVNNPLGGYGDNSFQTPRGAYVGMTVANNGNGSTSATVTLDIYEPLLLSPLVFDTEANYTPGLVGVENMSYIATLVKPERLLSLTQDQGVTGQINITTITPTLTSAQLLFNFLTPDPVENIPTTLVSSYFNLTPYPTLYNVGNVPSGAAITITMQSVQLSSIPRRMIVFARIDDSMQTPFTPDSYLGIDTSTNPLTVQWNTQSFFATMSPADVYNMCVKNGYCGSWTQFAKQTGSVIAVDFGTDIGLMPEQAPGTLDKNQLQLTIKLVNNRPVGAADIPVTLYVIIVSEGTFSIINGSCLVELGILSKTDVLNATTQPFITYKKTKSVYGGDFFSSLKKGLSKANKFLKDNKIVSKIASAIPGPKAKAFEEFARNLGYGVTGGEMDDMDGGALVGGKKKPCKAGKRRRLVRRCEL